MNKLTFAAPCLMGLEGICADELKRLEIENVRAENGRVLFDGGFRTLAKANIRSRYAERIQILLGEFPAYSFEDLFEGTAKIPWEEFISEKEAFPVKGHSIGSKLTSIPDCQKIIKKSVAKRLGGYRLRRSLFQGSRPPRVLPPIFRRQSLSSAPGRYSAPSAQTR